MQSDLFINDLQLILSPVVAGNSYDVKLLRWNDGAELTVDTLAEVDFERLESDYLTSLRSFIDTPFPPDRLRKLGCDLARLLLPHQVREKLLGEQLRGFAANYTRLRLTIKDPVLAGLPWEYIYLDAETPVDGIGGYLGLQSQFSIVRQSSTTRSGEVVDAYPLRVLIVCADPRSAKYPALRHLDAEVHSVVSELQAPGLHRHIRLETSRSATPAGLKRMLTEWSPHILHFIGHADEGATGSFLVLEGDQSGTERIVYADDLAHWLAAGKVRLTVLSACRSASPVRGIAQTLAEQGMPAVVAMQLPLRDSAAQSFARAFYGALAEPCSVEEALQEARRAIQGYGPDWGVPVLYLAGNDSDVFAPREAVGTFVHLPAPATRFIDRPEDVLQVVTRLRAERLVTLTGTGGVGKTRLAIRVVEEVQDLYHHGGCFVELAPLSAGSSVRVVADAVAKALDVRAAPGRDIVQTLSDYLHPKSLLLVLDNCEHVAEACAQVISDLLSQCPGLRILATSRHALNLRGEARWYVPSLSSPDPERLPAESAELVSAVSAYPAVTLFAERAAAVRNTFRLTPENARDVAQICAYLEGIPLALEMAAARIAALSAAQLAHHLHDSVYRLTSGSHADSSRHRTLRALIDWSHALLSEPEQHIFRRLSVFRGGWTLEAAQAVCADADMESWQFTDLLASLVNKSLITFEDQDSRIRYRMLETIRQYAEERLQASGERNAVEQRHLDYYLALAERSEPKLRSGEQMAWLRHLEAEHDNLRAALERSCTPDVADAGLRLAGSLWHFWEMQSTYTEGRDWLLASLNNSDTDGVARARALTVLGILADDICEAAQIFRYAEEGLRLARQAGNRWWISFATKVLGWLYRQTSPMEATRHLGKALAVAREEGDPWLLADVCSTLGYHQLYRGNTDSAWQYFREGVEHARKTRDLWLLDEMVYHLGLVACAGGDYEEALTHLDESLDLQKRLGSKTRLGTARYFKASILFQQGKLETALILLRESLLASQEAGTRRTMTAALQAMASLSMALGQPERSALLFGAAAVLQESIDATLLPIWSTEYERYQELCRTALGEDVFAVLWARGQGMPTEQVIALAVQ